MASRTACRAHSTGPLFVFAYQRSHACSARMTMHAEFRHNAIAVSCCVPRISESWVSTSKFVE